jgi:xanthosine utilization system XapX-like protein
MVGGWKLSTTAGLVAALVGAVLWAVTVEVTGYQIGVVAIGVGLLVGQVMSMTAGSGPRLPLVAAGLALLGCALGEVFIDAHEVAKVIGAGTPSMVRYFFGHPDVLSDVFVAGFSPLTLAFWGIAAGAGYRLAARGQAAAPLRAQPVGRVVAGPDFNNRGLYTAPAPAASPAAPAPAAVVARHPSDFFTEPSAPRYTAAARQAVLGEDSPRNRTWTPDHATASPGRTI